MLASDKKIAKSLALLTGSILGFLCFLPEEWIIRYPFTDDAFYYAQIARNIVNGKGVTFDGLHETNGFHPLWLLTLLPIYGLFSGDWLPLRAILGLQAILAALASFWLYRLLRRWADPGIAILAVILYQLLTFLLEISFSGMETGLQGLLLIYLLYEWPNIEKNTDKKAWLLGILLGLIVLARLDGVAVVLVVGLFLLWHLRKIPFPQKVAILSKVAVAFAGVIIPYFIWNLFRFGHIMPVSGAAKSYPWWERPLSETLDKLFWWAKALSKGLAYAGMGNVPPSIVGTLALGGGIFLLFYLGWGKSLLHTREAFLGISFGITHYLLESLTLTTFRGWYLITEVLMITLFLAWLWERHKILRGVGMGVYGVLFLGIGKLIRDWRLSPETNAAIYESYQVGLWLRAHTPPESRCATWNAGVIGYFAHRPVINLDGLVNTYEFLELSEAKLPQYLKEKSVRYLTTYTLAGTYENCPLFKKNWKSWMPILQNLIYTKNFYHRPADVFFDKKGGEAHYYIWKLE